MTTCWHFLCGACAKADDKDYSTLRENGSVGRSNYKQRHKRKSKAKGTWTRRSLLVNDEIDYEGVPMEEMAYHTKVVRGPQSFEISAFNLKSQSTKRKTVKELFGGAQNDRIATTIPNWMDENFVPNGRTATHLGISSVKINAKRNEISSRRSQELTTQMYRNSSYNHGEEPDKVTTSMTNLLIKRNSFNQESTASLPPPGGHVSTLPRTNASTNPRTLSSGVGVSGNRIDGSTNTVPRPTSLSTVSERPLVLRESQSDVGVRRIVPHTPGYRRSTPIPRLEDFTGGKYPTTTIHIDMPDGRSSQLNIDTRQQHVPGASPHYDNDRDTEISYSSNITFKKSDVSLKRSDEPAVFSSSNFTPKQQRPNLPYKSRSNPTPTPVRPNYAKPAESMYGYVPKIVRNLHASTVLEGKQIDDFFMQRMHDRELEKFATLERDKQRAGGPAVVTRKECTVEPSPKLKVRQTIPYNNVISGSESAVDTPNVPVSLPQPNNTKHLQNGLIEKGDSKSTSDGVAVTSNTSPGPTNGPQEWNGIQVQNASTENQVIMIDFPPNLEKDKPKVITSPVQIGYNVLTETNVPKHDENLEPDINSNVRSNESNEENLAHLKVVQNISEQPIKPVIGRPRITMGVARTRAATRTDSDASKRSAQSTASSLLESAEVLY